MNGAEAQLYAPDWIVIAGFFVSMLLIGGYFAGRMKTARDFFSGGQNVPWWLSGTSFYMSSFSSFTFVAYSAIAYTDGWVAVVIYWVTVPAAILSGYYFAALWRRAASTSPLEFLDERYNAAMRQSVAGLYIPTKLIDDGLKLFAIGTLIMASLGFEDQINQQIAAHTPFEYQQGDLFSPAVTLAVVFSGVIILAYTFLGGLWAVLITDFVQFVVMMAAVIVLIPLSLAQVGGLGGLLEQAPEGFFSFTTDKYDVKHHLAFVVIMLLSFSSQWALVQRYYSVRTDRSARKVGYLVAALNLLTPPLLFLPAIAARVYLPGQDENQIYGILCRHLLPVGMVGMLIAAMFSATMSMLSSDYNAVSAVLTNDLLRRWWPRPLSDRQMVNAGRLFTCLIGLLSLIVAFIVQAKAGDAGLFDIMAGLFSIFLPPIAIPMLAGLLSPHARRGGALLGLWLGVTAGVACFFLGQMEPYAVLQELWLKTLITVVTTSIGLYVGSVLDQPSEARRERIAAFFDRLRAPETPFDRSAPQAGATSTMSPLPIIGAITGLLGLLLIVAVFIWTPEEILDQRPLSLIVGFLMMLAGAGFYALKLVIKEDS